VTDALGIVEALVEALALVAGLTWQFHTICRTVRTCRDHIRLTMAAIAVACVTALVLEYLRLRLSEGSAHVVIDLASALLLLLVGIAWLRPAILLSSGIRLSPGLLSLVPPLKHLKPPVSSTNTLVVRRSYTWPAIGLTGGLLVAALNNGKITAAASAPVSLALLLVSCGCAIRLAGKPAALSNKTLRIIAGALFAALGSFQVSELLGVGWRHPASVLPALIAAYIAITYWLIEACRSGEPRHPRPDSMHADPVPSTRNALLTVDVCVWTALVGICVRFGWIGWAGMMDWQVGLLLFVGFILALIHSVLVDIRLPVG
jgi:uncharacterized membrane protein